MGEAIEPTEKESLERLGRYVARAPIALSKVDPEADGRVRLRTPPDPQTGKESRLLDPLAWVHAGHDTDPGSPSTSSCATTVLARVVRDGSTARPKRKSRGMLSRSRVGTGHRGQGRGHRGPVAARGHVSCGASTRWTRSPVLVCGHELKVVAVITDPIVVDRILAHRRRRQMRSPFRARAPPAEAVGT